MSHTLLPPTTSPLRRVAGAVLRSPVGSFLDGLAAPHGLSRYLEIVDPLLARDLGRAVITDVRRETADTTTLTLRPNRWAGHLPGQYVQLDVEIDGRKFTRCYSVSSATTRTDGEFTITVKADPAGKVSPFLAHRAAEGLVVGISPAMGEFALPDARPERVLLISGGSGITPVMSMLRTLVAEGASTQITFLHYGRTLADIAFLPELWQLERENGNVRLVTVLTGDASASDLGLRGHLSAEHLDAVLGGASSVPTFVCGPEGLIDAATSLYDERGNSDDLHLERFKLANAAPVAGVAGTVTFADSRIDVASDGGTLLDQAEAAGLTPKAGCRMGICHTCIRPKISGQVRDVRDGRLSSCDPEDVQICVTAPVGDVTIDL